MNQATFQGRGICYAVGIKRPRSYPLQTILQTKLRPTFVGTQLLARERLLSGLRNNAAAVRLVIVHGAAGSGKSSLLSEFVRSSSAPVAWLNLTDGDRDPCTFADYFVSALSATYPALKAQATFKDAPFGEPREVATALINELISHSQRFALILDDYHLVAGVEWIQSFMEILVRQGPANLTLLLGSREKPALPLPYLRSKGMLLEILPSQMRFTEAEVEQLFCAVLEQPLAPALVKILHSKTEGWITGLTLVAQTMRNLSPEQVCVYLENLQGNDEFIYEYLACEVFLNQRPHVQEFLKLTAVAERFNIELAAHLSGSDECVKILHYLDSARLFLVHLDSGWYRYHHLFCEFLRRRLAVEDGLARFQDTHARIALWCEDGGDIGSAIHHHLEARQLDAARRLLEQVGSELLGKGLQTTVSSWLEAFPASQLQLPGLRCLKAELYDYQGNWTRSVDEYRRALSEYRAAGDEVGESATVEKLALCLTKYGETGQLLAVCEEGLERCPAHNLALGSNLRSWLGCSLLYAGVDWERGYALLRESHSMALQSGEPRTLSWAYVGLGFVYHFTRGNFSESLRLLNEGIETFRNLSWWIAVFHLSLNKALVLAIQGSHGAALAVVEETEQLALESGHQFILKGLEAVRAIVYVGQGRLAEAEATLALSSASQIPAQMQPFYHRTQMLLHCLQGKNDQARVDSEEMERILNHNGHGMYAPECWLAEVYRLWKIGQSEPADALLEKCIRLCERAETKFYLMKSHQMAAILAHHQKSRWASKTLKRHLNAALTLTSSNGYEVHWLQGGADSTALLLWARAKGYFSVEVTGLLEKLEGQLQNQVDELLAHPCPFARREIARWLIAYDSFNSRRIERLAHNGDATVRQSARQAMRVFLPDPEPIRIAALGQLQISQAGNSLLNGVRPLALKLLRFFLSRGDQLVGDHEIIEAFWPQTGYEKARHNLSAHISLLRKTLATPLQEEVILRSEEGYRLQLTGIEYDVRRFETLFSQARKARLQNDGQHYLEYASDAESLYAADFLEDELYMDCVIEKRAELRGCFVDLTEQLADHYLARGQQNEAMKRYRSLLQIDNTNESSLQKLLSVLTASGDRAGAHREFQVYRTRLWETLGLHPDPKTEELISRI